MTKIPFISDFVDFCKRGMSSEKKPNYIVMDLEWNQPVCREKAVKKPVYLSGEIIQIGAVKLNHKFKRMDSFKAAVRPMYYTRMHGKVRRLTGITNADLKQGMTFQDAFYDFTKWAGDNYILLTWGVDDYPILRDNLILHRMDPAVLPEWYNVQIVYDTQIGDLYRQCALELALEKTGETGSVAHDALQDAEDTVRVMNHLDMKQGLLDYDGERFSGMMNARCVGKTNYCTPFDTKRLALQDPDVGALSCPVCKKLLTTGKWYFRTNQKCCAVACCAKDGSYFMQVRFTQNSESKYLASRTVYEMNDELQGIVDRLMEKQQTRRQNAEQNRSNGAAGSGSSSSHRRRHRRRRKKPAEGGAPKQGE